jgi:hypothetical protein
MSLVPVKVRLGIAQVVQVESEIDPLVSKAAVRPGHLYSLRAIIHVPLGVALGVNVAVPSALEVSTR